MLYHVYILIDEWPFAEGLQMQPRSARLNNAAAILCIACRYRYTFDFDHNFGKQGERLIECFPDSLNTNAYHARRTPHKAGDIPNPTRLKTTGRSGKPVFPKMASGTSQLVK